MKKTLLALIVVFAFSCMEESSTTTPQATINNTHPSTPSDEAASNSAVKEIEDSEPEVVLENPFPFKVPEGFVPKDTVFWEAEEFSLLPLDWEGDITDKQWLWNANEEEIALDTPLSLAIKAEDHETTKALLDAGVNPNQIVYSLVVAKDSYSSSVLWSKMNAYDMARRKGDAQLVEYIQSHGGQSLADFWKDNSQFLEPGRLSLHTKLGYQAYRHEPGFHPLDETTEEVLIFSDAHFEVLGYENNNPEKTHIRTEEYGEGLIYNEYLDPLIPLSLISAAMDSAFEANLKTFLTSNIGAPLTIEDTIQYKLASYANVKNLPALAAIEANKLELLPFIFSSLPHHTYENIFDGHRNISILSEIIRIGDTKAAEKVLSLGVKLDDSRVQNDAGLSPPEEMFLAGQSGSPEMVQWLESKGVDKNLALFGAIGQKLEYQKDLVVLYDNLDNPEWFRSGYSGNWEAPILAMAAHDKDWEYVKILIDAGADVNLPFYSYSYAGMHSANSLRISTPLNLALNDGEAAVVDLLKEKGAKTAEELELYLKPFEELTYPVTVSAGTKVDGPKGEFILEVDTPATAFMFPESGEYLFADGERYTLVRD
jgi:hypothetical protein